MTGKCKDCGVHFDPHTNGVPAHFDAAPFAGNLLTMTGACPNCKCVYVAAHHTARPKVFYAWRVKKEQMTEGTDYLWAVKPENPIDGRSPLVICWLWTPMPGNEEIESLLLAKVKADTAFNRRDVRTILAMSAEQIPDIYPDIMNDFDGTLLLKQSVMMTASGPYPSLRAERSLQATFAPCGLRGICTYWPTYTLKQGYTPLETDMALSVAWGKYARQALTVSQPESE